MNPRHPSNNRLEKTVGGAGQTTWRSYDANGSLECEFDPRHAAAAGSSAPACGAGPLVTQYVRDALGRVVGESGTPIGTG